MSSSLEYTHKALEAKSLFYGKKIVVYVEGGDDEVYWEKIVRDDDIHIESVNGIIRLMTYMDNIIGQNARYIVACDLDHSPFLQELKYTHVRIVTTYGYSIENSMYCSDNLNNIIKKACRKRINLKAELDKWLIDFSTSCTELLKYDIANHRYSKGIQVFGDSCSRFLTNKKSNTISESKVNKHIESFKNSFSNKEISEVEELIYRDKRKINFLIKGHFLSLAVINTIKKYVKKELGKENFNFSQENLFSETCRCNGLCTSQCIAISKEINNMKLAINSI